MSPRGDLPRVIFSCDLPGPSPWGSLGRSPQASLPQGLPPGRPSGGPGYPPGVRSLRVPAGGGPRHGLGDEPRIDSPGNLLQILASTWPGRCHEWREGCPGRIRWNTRVRRPVDTPTHPRRSLQPSGGPVAPTVQRRRRTQGIRGCPTRPRGSRMAAVAASSSGCTIAVSAASGAVQSKGGGVAVPRGRAPRTRAEWLLPRRRLWQEFCA